VTASAFSGSSDDAALDFEDPPIPLCMALRTRLRGRCVVQEVDFDQIPDIFP
jgi:hypothetical protein